MRRILLAIAGLAALLSVTALSPNQANAMTLPVPAGINTALAGENLAEEVAYVCRRRCGPYGCVRRCFYTRPAYGYGYYGGYRPYRPYGGYGYYRRW